MDTTKTVAHVGLCAGYGGIELGLKRVLPNLRSIALCEIEAYAIANLVSKMEAGFMDPAPIWPDLKTFPWQSFRGKVDILTGGYPCQPFSAAGKRLGKDDPRHLWPWIANGIAVMRPSICFFENVEGHISLGLPDVIEDLAGMGYRTTWGIFSAEECGAPHRRKRVFILAHCIKQGLERYLRDVFGWNQSRWIDSNENRPACKGGVWPNRPGEEQLQWEPPRVVGNAEGRQDNGREPRDMEGEAKEGGCGDNAADGSGEELADTGISGCDGRPDGTSGWSRESGEASEDASGWRSESHGMRQTQSPLGGNADGLANRMDYGKLCVSSDNRTDELRLLGNGVVPATAALAFTVLINDFYRPSCEGWPGVGGF